MSRDWTEATVLGLGWSSGVQGKSMYRRRLEPSLDKRKNSLGNTWMVLGFYIRGGRSYESWGMSHSGVQMSKKEDNDKAKMSQCEKKLMVIQGIKDRSVTRKQGCGDEGETGEAGEEKQRRTRRWVSVGRWGDPGEIQGRSIDPGGSVFRGVGGSTGKGIRRGGAGAESANTRIRAR